LSEFYIERKDPVAKAERALKKKNFDLSQAQESDSREPLGPGQEAQTPSRKIPASVLHESSRPRSGPVSDYFAHGLACHEERWVEIHHLHLFSEGGQHDVANLLTGLERSSFGTHRSAALSAGSANSDPKPVKD